MLKIAPSIMCADFSILGEEIKNLEKAGADIFHFDIMDGNFVPNITMGPIILKSLRDKTKLPFESHLMVTQPEKVIKQFVEAGSDIIIFHIESTQFPHRLIKEISLHKNIKIGVSLNPATPISFLESVIYDIDMVLIMTVEPGFAGGEFIPEVIPKIQVLTQIIKEKKLSVEIGVDGGINEKTIPVLVKAGANILIAGSTSIFKKEKNYASEITNMRTLANV